MNIALLWLGCALYILFHSPYPFLLPFFLDIYWKRDLSWAPFALILYGIGCDLFQSVFFFGFYTLFFALFPLFLNRMKNKLHPSPLLLSASVFICTLLLQISAAVVLKKTLLSSSSFVYYMVGYPAYAALGVYIISLLVEKRYDLRWKKNS